MASRPGYPLLPSPAQINTSPGAVPGPRRESSGYFVTHYLFLCVQVYDKNLTSDEFMGSTMISISNLELYKYVLPSVLA